MLKHPPSGSTGIFSDIRYFFLNKPEYETKIRFQSEEERLNYRQSILQRTGIGMDKYSVLNIHRIGIETPATFVFEELLKWNGDSSCWPNHIAKVKLKDGDLQNIGKFVWMAEGSIFSQKGIGSFKSFSSFQYDCAKNSKNTSSFRFR